MERFEKMRSKKNQWFREMPELKRLCLYSNLILLPGVIILLCYETLGILLHIPLTYLILDVVAVLLIRRHECYRIARQKEEEEEELSGRTILCIRHKLEELRQIGR